MPATIIEATVVDLLLTLTETNEPEEPMSTEFVGQSDQRDAVPTAADPGDAATDEESMPSAGPRIGF